MNENSLDILEGRGVIEDAFERAVPALVIDIRRAVFQNRNRAHILAFRIIQPLVGHRPEPDIGVEPDLVRGVPCQHRPASRLR